MTAALVLLAFAGAASVVGARLLGRATWPTRSPAWGIWAWQVLTVSTAAAVVLTGVVIAIPETPLHTEVAALLSACSEALAHHYATPGGLPVAVVALGVSVFVLVRFVTVAVRDFRGAASRRRAQSDVLTLVGREHPDGFTVVDHATPLVYCLPGRTGSLVVTSAAQDALTAHQLDLVLAHERQHLRAHHHTALTFSAALSKTFFGLGVFGLAHERIAALAEMQADDAVSPAGDRHDLARALLSLTPASPATGVALASSTHGRAVQRVRRLTERREQPGRRVALAAAGLGLATLLAPAALALLPALEVAVRDCCPSAFSHLPDENRQESGGGGGLREDVVE